MFTLINSRLSNLTTKGFAKTLETNLPLKQVFGRGAKTQFATSVNIDEEIEFIFPPEVTVSKYEEDASNPEELGNALIKIKVQYPLYYNVFFSDIKINQVNAMAHEKGAIFMTDMIKNATEKFNNALEYAYVALSSQCGFKLNGSVFNQGGDMITPIALNPSNIKQFFQQMRGLMTRGQVVAGVPRSSWVEGKMTMVVSPEIMTLLTTTSGFQYAEQGLKIQIDGYVGDFAGFKIVTSNHILADENGNYTVVAFVEGEAFGCIMQKNLTSEHVRWLARIGDVFRGWGIFGVGIIRHDKCGAAYVSVSFD
jgi:hypothetical protein